MMEWWQLDWLGADMATHDLTDAEIRHVSDGHCPDCNHRGFVLGPRGGAAQNIECGNMQCRARFNIVQGPRTHHAIWGHRIDKFGDGGADWDAIPRPDMARRLKRKEPPE